MVYSTNGGANWSSLQSELTNIKNAYPYTQSISSNLDYILYSGYQTTNSSTNLYVAKSTNGSTWTEHLVASNVRPDQHVMFWNGTKWLFVVKNSSDRLSLTESTDGETWTPLVTITSPISYSRPRSLSYFNNKWVITLDNASILTSADSLATTWTVAYTGTNSSYDPLIKDSTFYIMDTSNSELISTQDLINWTTLSSISNNPLPEGSIYNTYFSYIGSNYVSRINGYPNGNETSYLGYNSTTSPNTWTWGSPILTPLSQFISPKEIIIEVPCLIQGMEINIENGVKKVEELKVGDIVVDILNKKFTITQTLSKKVIGNEQNIPYIIPKDYFEKDLPTKDIYLSYNHSYFYNGEWRIPIHDDNLKQDYSLIGKEITYYHIALPNYSTDKLVCYNLPVDSFDNNKYTQDNMI